MPSPTFLVPAEQKTNNVLGAPIEIFEEELELNQNSTADGRGDSTLLLNKIDTN